MVLDDSIECAVLSTGLSCVQRDTMLNMSRFAIEVEFERKMCEPLQIAVKI